MGIPTETDSPTWTEDYVWIVVLACFASLFASFGIGANDVANAFATSVGAKAVTLKQAIFLAAIFEFLGAFLLGSNVMKTVRKDIADVECFQDNPALLMHGMFCALLTTGFWLLIASKYKMPVSTTHTIIGAIIGMTMAVTNPDCVQWYKKKDDWPYVGGVGGIVLSWVIAPMLSYFFAAALFLAVKYSILRSPNSYDRAFWFYPGLVWATSFTLSLFMLYKGAKSQGWLKKLADDESEQDAWAALIAAIIATVITAVTMPFGLPWIRRRIEAQHEANTRGGTNAATDNGGSSDKDKKIVRLGEVELAENGQSKKLEHDEEEVSVSTSLQKMDDGFMAKADLMFDEMEKNVLSLDAASQKVHDNAEVFDAKTELFFRYVQVLTASINAFAHGANDVANAVGPLAGVWIVYKTHHVSEKAELGYDAYWLLALGGAGIVFGLALYGYKIIQVLGCEMAKMTPSRGFAVELGAVAVIIMGTRLGIPLSTTHCQVGATCGVAHAEGRAGVNYRSLGVVLLGWVLTLIVAASTAALFVSLGAFAPSAYGPAYKGMPNPLEDLYELEDLKAAL